uniref:Uncharacterized protein n=1 Tax=Anguilla anguilla TaxID=7936 RepID=A0A0E9UMF2_ANGAN
MSERTPKISKEDKLPQLSFKKHEPDMRQSKHVIQTSIHQRRDCCSNTMIK